MNTRINIRTERLLFIGLAASITILLAMSLLGLNTENWETCIFIVLSDILALGFLMHIYVSIMSHSSSAHEKLYKAITFAGDRSALIRTRITDTDAPTAKSLLKTSALQDAIFNSGNFSHIATDIHGVIQIFNVGAERMLGYNACDVINKVKHTEITDAQVSIDNSTESYEDLITKYIPGFEALVFKASRGTEDIYELMYIRKDGSRFPAVVSLTKLRDTEDKIIGYLLIGTDNSERKNADIEQMLSEQRLRDQQFYTRSLIESNIDALITTDLHGIISDVNQQMELLTGCTREELIGSPFKNYFTNPAQADSGIKTVLCEGKITNYELTAKMRNGTETIVSFNASTFHNRDQKLQGVFAAARDVTDFKKVESLLKEKNIELQYAKAIAEKANLAKSDFLSSMSHELRTPLNAMLGFAQLLNSDTPPPSTSQKASIDQILQAGWHLLRLINEILDLTMIESGKVSITQEPILLEELLQDCEAMMEPQAQNRNIKLTFHSFDNSLYVCADRTRLKQVMINLLTNAIKYNGTNGAVIVQCVKTNKNRVRISVTDNGAGLSSDQIAQLFQPFNRLGQENGTEEGTGIGLIVTKQLIQLMGGNIGVESTISDGSVFWIDLAIAHTPHNLIHQEIKISTQPTSKTIENINDEFPKKTIKNTTVLYIEDNPANLILVAQLIARRHDLKLMTAIDAHIGIHLARNYRPHVILMDINLPGLNGYSALKILQNDPTTTHIPIMAVSANALPRDIVKGLEAGFFRYLTKPININEFMDALNVALDFADEYELANNEYYR